MDERTHARYMSDIAYFLSKMEAEPNSSYFIPIALAYNKLEKYDETIAMCKTAIERFPSNCAVKTFLAEAYVYKGFFDQARELLFDVTAEDDNNYKALKLLGIICKEQGDNTEALKYLTGAFIRSPEDEEVRKMIDELGGTLNPGEIYDERMKKHSQSAADSEEDEELKTYQEIDKRIRNAEIIMADLVSDTSINSRNYEEEEDFDSDDPNDYMPLITQHEEPEESFSDDPNDFLPNITPSQEDEDISQLEQHINDTNTDDLFSALSEDSENEDENNSDNDLISSLSSEEEIDNTDDLFSALSEDSESEDENNSDNDLISSLSGEEETDNTDDLFSALSEDSENEEENNSDDLISSLSGEEETDNTDDLFSALSEDKENEEEKVDIDKETNVEDNIDTTTEIKNDSLETNDDENIDSKTIEPLDENNELLDKKVPSSIADMTYDDMIDDDFQYGKIIDDSYKDSDSPSIDLGDSAPFTQGDIMDEILDAVGMTQEDMADDEKIEISDKDRKLIRLENFLDKIQNNRENK